MANDEYITKPNLKNRGWTDAMVKKFLGAPDMTKPNPHYKSAAPMGLWLAKRVNQVERTAEWKAEKEKSAGRKTSAQKAVKTKTDKAKEFAQTVEIHVPVTDFDWMMLHLLVLTQTPTSCAASRRTICATSVRRMRMSYISSTARLASARRTTSYSVA